jgi:hypothetical protein
MRYIPNIRILLLMFILVETIALVLIFVNPTKVTYEQEHKDCMPYKEIK